MANKKTIHQLELELDRYVRKMNHAARKITETRELIKKIRMGKVKQPAPPGKKVMLSTMTPAQVAEYTAEFDDVIPSFGSTPAIGG